MQSTATWHSAIDLSMHSTCWPPCLSQGFQATFLLARIFKILPQVLCSQTLLNDSLSLFFLEVTQFSYILYSDLYLLWVLQNLFALFYQLIECWSSVVISWTRLVELVSWQGLYPWINGSFLLYSLKPQPKL